MKRLPLQKRWMAVHKHQLSIALTMAIGMMKYTNEFMEPYWNASRSFWDTEQKKKIPAATLWQTASDYMELLLFNCQIWGEGYLGMSREQLIYLKQEIERLRLVDKSSEEDFFDYWENLDSHMKALVYDFPKEIEKVEGFGFDFKDSRYRLVAETPRFNLY
ncbi:MAG: hypothetical protein ABRQ31_11570, partial [Smithellaceae bacterium]